MNPALVGDLSGLEFPRDLEQVRDIARHAISEGQSLSPLYRALASEHPVALGDLAAGPRALTGSRAVHAALRQIESLEQVMGLGGLYRRLLQLDEETRAEVLEAAICRHPQASWVISLSEVVENTPGRFHLHQLLGNPDFVEVCWHHARAGHREALLELAEEGHPQPAAALLAAGDLETALDAAMRALVADPACPVVPWLTGVAGPGSDGVLCGLICRIQSPAVADALALATAPFPKTRSLLHAIRKGLR